MIDYATIYRPTRTSPGVTLGAIEVKPLARGRRHFRRVAVSDYCSCEERRECDGLVRVLWIAVAVWLVAGCIAVTLWR